MIRTLICFFFIFAFAVLAGPVIGQETAASRRSAPNILLIIADDMGYGDLACTGTTVIKTSNLDALAQAGKLCTQAYVTSSVCAPSRSGLITGRYPARIGFETNLGRWSEATHTRRDFFGLHVSEATLADHLKANGYRTGAVGKWHLGYEDVHYPTQRGFDYFCGMRGGSHNYFLQPGKGSIERNGARVTKFSSPYITDFFSDEAVRFIGKGLAKEQAKPWFLYLAYNAPHAPMQATEADLARYAHVKNKKRRAYCAMVHALDRGVGRVVKKLKSQGQFGNTLIVFISDNGGPRKTNASWNGDLSGSKGNLKEGGIRVPMIVTWPDQIPAGKRYDGVISTLDLLPTMMRACGGNVIPLTDGRGKKKTDRVYDGIDVLAELVTGKPTPNRTLFWRLQGQAAVLDGQSNKLIRLSHRPAQVFHLSDDLGERSDLARGQPEVTDRLFRLMFDWERGMTTFQHFQTSPYWLGPSAKNYDEYVPADEPK